MWLGCGVTMVFAISYRILVYSSHTPWFIEIKHISPFQRTALKPYNQGYFVQKSLCSNLGLLLVSMLTVLFSGKMYSYTYIIDVTISSNLLQTVPPHIVFPWGSAFKSCRYESLHLFRSSSVSRRSCRS